jgi:membrane protein DedA with SNARE-associated domain
MNTLIFAIHLHHPHGPSVDYVGLALAAFASWVGVPGPGEAALIAAGVLAARGRLDLAEVIAFAFLGAAAGGVVGWLIGLKAGRALADRPGPLQHFRQRALEKGERFFDRYGVLAVFFTPSWLAGVNRMAAWRYNVANLVSALLWALVVGLGSYVVGPSIAEVTQDIGLAGVLTVLASAAAGAILERRRRRRRVSRSAPPA